MMGTMLLMLPHLTLHLDRWVQISGQGKCWNWAYLNFLNTCETGFSGEPERGWKDVEVERMVGGRGRGLDVVSGQDRLCRVGGVMGWHLVMPFLLASFTFILSLSPLAPAVHNCLYYYCLQFLFHNYLLVSSLSLSNSLLSPVPYLFYPFRHISLNGTEVSLCESFHLWVTFSNSWGKRVCIKNVPSLSIPKKFLLHQQAAA